jgi:hypothetical protein
MVCGRTSRLQNFVRRQNLTCDPFSRNQNRRFYEVFEMWCIQD